jgi:hypothetical protein
MNLKSLRKDQEDQEDDVEVSAEEILDEEILEIPAFLRRQSK